MRTEILSIAPRMGEKPTAAKNPITHAARDQLARYAGRAVGKQHRQGNTRHVMRESALVAAYFADWNESDVALAFNFSRPKPPLLSTIRADVRATAFPSASPAARVDA